MRHAIRQELQDIKEQLKESIKEVRINRERSEKLLEKVLELTDKLATSERKNQDLQSRLNLVNKEHYGSSKRQKGRNDGYTTNIINNIKLKMLDLLATEACNPGTISDLMRRALNYLHTFWKQLFAYRNDGEYTIDNLVAERTIRNMTIQRKNSLFFCSDKDARNSAIYNTFISTCRQMGVSFRDYFRKLMKELGTGRTDYENLLPMTIGV